jgi:hypothetical protein
MKTILFLFLLTVTLPAYCPAAHDLVILENKSIHPFEKTIFAIGMTESRNNDNAVNPSEMSYGRYQIRRIRLLDYYQRTGIRYSLPEMKDSVKARKVLNYYCSVFGPYRQDELILNWNCQSKEYLKKVKKHLN